MGKTIDTLIDDIYAVLDPETDHEVNEENLERFGEAVKNAVRDHFRKRDDKRGLRFSGLGKQARQLWYDAHPDPDEPPEAMDGPTMMKFLYGHLLEAAMLFLAEEAGHEVTCQQEKVEVDGVKGHIDAVIDGVLVDAKSASPYGYKKFAAGELDPADDAFGYIQQLSGYANVKELPAAFFAANKVSGELCISPLSHYAIQGHPPGPRIAELREHLGRDVPPDRCYAPVPDGKSGNQKLGVGCGYCKHKWRCWPGLRGFAYSNGPVFLTTVARTPDVPEFDRNGRIEA